MKCPLAAAIHVTTILLLIRATPLCSADAPAAPSKLGQFQASVDVGKVDPVGSSKYDPASGVYTLVASGANIWGKVDAFHFLYRKISGDVTVSADIEFVGQGKNAHRKAGLMLRQSLDADAPYVDVMVHGEGLISLQYRSEKGGTTKGIDAKAKSPATVRLERKGDLFTLFVKPKDLAEEKVGEIKLALPDPLYAGLALSSHDPAVSETVHFSNVTLTTQEKK